MNLIRLFRYLKKKDVGFIFISLCFILCQVWLELKMPDYMSEITKLVQTEGSQMKEILMAGGAMLLCAMGSLVATLIVGFFGAKISAGLAMYLRDGVYCQVMDFTMEDMGKFSTASLITRSTNDITQVQSVVAMGLQVVVRAPIMAVWAIIKISGKNWQWTETTGVAVVILLIMLLSVFRLVIPRFKKLQILTDNLNRITRENLTGIRVVRAYNAENYQEDKFEKANEDLTATNLFTQRTMAVMGPGMTLISSGLTLAIYWVGVYLIDAAALGDKLNLFSDMVVFSSYAMQVIAAFMMLTMTMLILPRATVSAKRINEILTTVPRIKDGTFEISEEKFRKADEQNQDEVKRTGTIEFKNVSFRYPDAADNILQNISFKAKPGETVAIIGSTGSGKSTLVNLIPRFYDATDGEILVDGVNVKNYKQKALRNKIGYVLQRAVLFSGTVTSNISYGDNGRNEQTDRDLLTAAQTAQAESFISEMDGNFEASISQGGTNVSGGQKQRLSIARAIYRNPEIYIFDDSFSALDYKTDRILRDTLKKNEKGATMLIVAQRISTILHADQILVMDEGTIVGKGTHKELLKNCDVYREIAQSQLSKEELEYA